MTQALQELLSMVEAGCFPADTSASDIGVDPSVLDGLPVMSEMYKAHSGSFDAALSLHWAMLSRWSIYVGMDDNRQWFCELREGYQTSFSRVVGISKQPTAARALLIAILKALIAEGE